MVATVRTQKFKLVTRRKKFEKWGSVKENDPSKWTVSMKTVREVGLVDDSQKLQRRSPQYFKYGRPIRAIEEDGSYCHPLWETLRPKIWERKTGRITEHFEGDGPYSSPVLEIKRLLNMQGQRLKNPRLRGKSTEGTTDRIEEDGSYPPFVLVIQRANILQVSDPNSLYQGKAKWEGIMDRFD